MDGTGFLKTVSFGGFDKKDVLAYVDELNTKIYTLEAELDEKKPCLKAPAAKAAELTAQNTRSFLPLIRLRSPSSRPTMTPLSFR